MSESTDKPLPEEQSDEQLDEYLKGDSSVSRHYRQLHSADVPAELERLVLRQAEEAVERRPAKSRSWMRWSGPLAIAASALVVLSIVIETGVQKEALMITVPASAPILEKQRSEPAEQDAAGNVASEEFAAAAEAEQKSGGTAADKEVRIELPRVRRASPPAADIISPKAPPARIESTDAAPKLEMPEPEVARQLEPQAEPAQAIAQSAPPPVAAPAEPVVVTAQRRSVADVAEHSAAGVTESSALEEVSIAGTRVQHSENRLAGPRNTVPPASASEYARDERVEEPEQREYSDPEAWLKDIRKLRKRNKQEAADREWRRFRAAFPNYAVADTDIAREVKK